MLRFPATVLRNQSCNSVDDEEENARGKVIIAELC